jgi:hypothetical protein
MRRPRVASWDHPVPPGHKASPDQPAPQGHPGRRALQAQQVRRGSRGLLAHKGPRGRKDPRVALPRLPMAETAIQTRHRPRGRTIRPRCRRLSSRGLRVVR